MNGMKKELEKWKAVTQITLKSSVNFNDKNHGKYV